MTFPVEIRTSRLDIREFTPDDGLGLSGMTSDPAVVRHLSFGATSSAETAALLDFAVVSALAVPRVDYVLAIDERAAGVLTGACGLYADGDSGRDCEVFFVIRRNAWGQGLATEAMRALVDYGFRELGLARIYGVAHPENVASMRVMERAGMRYDGDVPDAFEDEDGWRAGRRYAILAPSPMHEVPMNEDVQRELMKAGVVDITTKGRRTGEARRIEIRLHNIDDQLYLTGQPGPRGWHANLRANPTFTIHLKRDLVADVRATAIPVQGDDERRRVHRRILENMGKPEELDARMKSSPLMKVNPLQQD